MSLARRPPGGQTRPCVAFWRLGREVHNHSLFYALHVWILMETGFVKLHWPPTICNITDHLAVRGANISIDGECVDLRPRQP